MAQVLTNTMSEGSFEGVSGLNIFTRSWRPEGEPRGVVVIVPGFNSHSGQYLWVGEQFAARGLAAQAAAGLKEAAAEPIVS